MPNLIKSTGPLLLKKPREPSLVSKVPLKKVLPQRCSLKLKLTLSKLTGLHSPRKLRLLLPDSKVLLKLRATKLTGLLLPRRPREPFPDSKVLLKRTLKTHPSLKATKLTGLLSPRRPRLLLPDSKVPLKPIQEDKCQDNLPKPRLTPSHMLEIEIKWEDQDKDLNQLMLSLKSKPPKEWPKRTSETVYDL